MISVDRSKRKRTVVVRGGLAGKLNRSQPPTKLDEVGTDLHRSVILQLVAVLVCGRDAEAVSAVAKRLRHGDCGQRREGLGFLIATVALVLKAGLVDDPCAQRLSIADLQLILGAIGVERLRWQREGADSVIRAVIAVELVARSQRVPGSELEVESRRDRGTRLRMQYGQSLQNRIEIGINHATSHHSAAFHPP